MAQALARRRSKDDSANYLAREAEAPPQNYLEMAQALPERLIPRGAQPVGPGFEMLPAEAPPPGSAKRQYGPPAPPRGYVDFPIGRNGETERRPMGGSQTVSRRYPSPASATNPIDYAGGVVQDIVDEPWLALQGSGSSAGLALGAGGELLGVIGNLSRGPRRAFTEAESEAFLAARRKNDIELSRQPPYAVQKRAGGRFQKFDEATRIERERGIAARRAEQEARDAMAKKSAAEREQFEKYWSDPERAAARQRDLERMKKGSWSASTPEEISDVWKRPPKKPFPPY